MERNERLVEALNQALHAVLGEDATTLLLGEDVGDPYGGAFKVSRGLSTQFPGRVLNTPISEQALLGIGGGLAMCGNKAIVEVMFGDFLAIGFDQLLNFATKSVSMYGRRVPMRLLVRCPVGAGRGYGPTHSQQIQKHFIGIPNLDLYELTQFHEPTTLLRSILEQDHPAILFEDKVLYAQRIYRGGRIDDVFEYDFIDHNYVRIRSEGGSGECVVIAPGGLVERCLAGARRLLIDFEIDTQIVVPARLYPFDVAPLDDIVSNAIRIFVVEEGVEGGTWGAEVAHQLYKRHWGQLANRVEVLCSRDSIIPSAPHLEREVVLQADRIYDAVRSAFAQ